MTRAPAGRGDPRARRGSGVREGAEDGGGNRRGSGGLSRRTATDPGAGRRGGVTSCHRSAMTWGVGVCQGGAGECPQKTKKANKPDPTPWRGDKHESSDRQTPHPPPTWAWERVSHWGWAWTNSERGPRSRPKSCEGRTDSDGKKENPDMLHTHTHTHTHTDTCTHQAPPHKRANTPGFFLRPRGTRLGPTQRGSGVTPT